MFYIKYIGLYFIIFFILDLNKLSVLKLGANSKEANESSFDISRFGHQFYTLLIVMLVILICMMISIIVIVIVIQYLEKQRNKSKKIVKICYSYDIL